MNRSFGLIDVAQSADNNPLNCSLTIGNVGIANAVATFIIQRINISSCRYLDYLSFFCFVVGKILYVLTLLEPS